MKILFVHLSDMHIEKKTDIENFNQEKMIQALNIVGEIDKCIIVISGDITHSGLGNQYKFAGHMLGNLVKKLKDNLVGNKWIDVLVVPGNHDLDLTNNERTFEDIVNAYKNKNIDELMNKEFLSLKGFFEFANFNNCFKDGQSISQRKITTDRGDIGITLLNTAPLSLLGSTNEDKGAHYISQTELDKTKNISNNLFNIVIMHHNVEWFSDAVKENLRKTISKNISIVFTGHEHDGIGENRKFNSKDSLLCFQAPALSGDRVHEKGFLGIVIDTNDNCVKGYSFVWNEDYYKHQLIASEKLPSKNSGSILEYDHDFWYSMQQDDNKRLLKDYFICPTLECNRINEDNDLEVIEIEEIEDLSKIIYENNTIIINGDRKCGKSTLLKVLYNKCLEDKKIPIILFRDNLNLRKIEKIVKYAFDEQYDENIDYTKFEQIDKLNKILLIDDADRIEKSKLDKLIKYYSAYFENIVVIKENKIEIDIQSQVKNVLEENKTCYINVKPFLYSKRKLLIAKVYDLIGPHNEEKEKKEEVEMINKIISKQVRYFRLDPEFIINFVTQYTNKLNFNLGNNENVFSIVYETSIKTRLIKHIPENEVAGVFTALQEIAFYMHFNKLTQINSSKLVEIVEQYNKDYRQKVYWRNLWEGSVKANILLDKNGDIQFKDKNLLAYFVAHALNRKYYEDDVDDKLEYLLNHICFGINSDIVLFMALITNNPRIIKYIMDIAKSHFNAKEELNFDLNNLPYLSQSNFKVKDSIPTETEKKEQEKNINKYEEDVKRSEIIELINDYDYDEEDIMTFENQVLKSIKYIEIICKILPSFSHNMKASAQEDLVKAIYSYPNIFIYEVLKDISDNYKELVKEVYDDVSVMCKEKNNAEINIERIEKVIEQISIMLLVSLYQMVSNVATTSATIDVLNDFAYEENTNHRIMNLMMIEKTNRIEEFCDKALSFYNQTNIKLIKGLIHFTVRTFLLNHEVRIVGKPQALIDKFFSASKTDQGNRETIKNKIAKNRIIQGIN